jgi:hypothetical protein
MNQAGHWAHFRPLRAIGLGAIVLAAVAAATAPTFTP